MIEKFAQVVRVQGNMAMVALEQQGACTHCSANRSCGISILAKLFNRDTEYYAHNQIGARVGERVRVAIPESVLLKVSIMMYIQPLLWLIVTAALAQHYFSASHYVEAFAIGFGVLGFTLGFLIYKRFELRLRRNPENLPSLKKIVRMIPIADTNTNQLSPLND